MPFVELQTNAVLIDAPYAAALADAGLTSAFVSLLSHQAEHHDALAGLPGAFARCLAGIDALVAVGVAVTLNPVTARVTQTLLPDYLRFVAERLPAVRDISLSAVQPHGRAAANIAELLPDYDVLRDVVPEAQRVAAAAGIRLLNPYCGLPLCVGWADDIARSVEAFEAEGGGWRPTPGVENRDDKLQGPACEGCALRTRCGGAWRAVWSERGGRGISPPLRRVAPWLPRSDEAPGQAVVRVSGRPSAAQLAAVRAATAPTVWIAADDLDEDDLLPILQSGCTDFALRLEAAGLERASADTARRLRALRRLIKAGERSPPQGRLLVHLCVVGPESAAVTRVLQWAKGLGAASAARIGPEKANGA